jgi:hypothetical protein
MGFWDNLLNRNTINDVKQINEAKKQFKKSSATKKPKGDVNGEGINDFYAMNLYGSYGVQSFNSFYDSFINREFADERERIAEYRAMTMIPEIGDVIEDAVIEATQENSEGDIISLVVSEDLEENKNIVKNLQDEFNDLFYTRLDVKDKIWDLFYSFMRDGRLYFENIINTNKKKNGLINIKKLPADTMDFIYDPYDGEVVAYLQYLTNSPRQITTVDEAEKDNDVILFYPSQITYINSGFYGANKKQVLGYLEKAKQPFNQLKLLETSVVIYRLIRSPERLVFKIDTGNMPPEKSLKFVEQMRNSLRTKQTYDTNTGKMSNNVDITSVLENYFLPTSSDGRGSDVTSIGGNPSGFAELDDIYYFQKKLYRALKYPLSRIENINEGRSGDNNMFNNNQVGTITRDEIKWAKFIERQQNKFEKAFEELFLNHLEFKELREKYDITKNSLNIKFNPPNQYKQQMEQMLLETQFNNYSNLANNPEFSKKYLMTKYLKWTEDEIKDNSEMLSDDIKLGFKEKDQFG